MNSRTRSTNHHSKTTNSIAECTKGAEPQGADPTTEDDEDDDFLSTTAYVPWDPRRNANPEATFHVLMDPINRCKMTGDSIPLQQALESGVDPNLLTGPANDPPLAYTIKYMIGHGSVGEKRGCEILNILLRYGSDPNLRDSLGCTPLFYAASYGFPDYVPILIDAGANIDKLSRTGEDIFEVLNNRHENPNRRSRSEKIERLLKECYAEKVMENWIKKSPH